MKIVLLGYSRGLISSRKIEQACRENVVFIALACGQQPDHSTIATFISAMKDEILPLFRDILLVCQEMDLLGGTFFALDGLKLPSNASKEWSGTRSELHRKKERLEAKVKELLKEHVQEDKGDDPPPGPGGRRDRDHQVQRLQKQAERLEKWLKDNDPKYGTTGKEISSNLTDNDSAKMKMSHGVIQGYNSQALIDGKHQVIIHAEAFGRGQDHAHAPPMLEGALENLQSLGHGAEYFAGKTFTADTNYHSDTKGSGITMSSHVDLGFQGLDGLVVGDGLGDMALAGQRRHAVQEDIATKDDLLSRQMHHHVGFGMSHAQFEHVDFTLPLIEGKTAAEMVIVCPNPIRILKGIGRLKLRTLVPEDNQVMQNWTRVLEIALGVEKSRG